MQLTVLENACAEIRKALGLAPVTSEKKSKKAPEPSGEPKEKRAPSDYIVFSSKRVGPLVHKAEEGKEKKSRVGTVNQFAGFLWGQKKEWTDEEILAAWPLYTPPEVSKQALKKSSASSTGSNKTESEPVADEPKPSGKGSRGPQSEETKAKAKAKKEENKKKKAEDTFEEVDAVSVASASVPAASVPVASVPVASVPVASAPVAPVKASRGPQSEETKAKAKAKKEENKKKTEEAAPAPAAPASKKPATVDLWLDAWEHDGEHYFKNERGDVLSTDGLWIGHWDEKKIDISAPQPADFSKLDVRPQ